MKALFRFKLMFKDRPLNLVNTVLMLALHIAAIGAFFTPFQKSYLLLFLVHYLWFGFGSSLYYHRCLTHRSFELSTPLHLFFLLGALVGLGGDPIGWVAIHRYHHTHTDVEGDTHSPREGFWYAYLFWHMRMDMKQVEKWQAHTEDLQKFWFIRLAQGNLPTVLIHTSYALMIYFAFGVPALLYGFYLPLALSYQFCWMLIASLCHSPSLGERSAETPDQSRNIWWLGPFSFGESFHNNHHEKPRRMRAGLKWYEMDLTAGLVNFLKKIGLAKAVVR